jgi:hypothetical protein
MLYKAAIAEWNGNVRLEVKVAKRVHRNAMKKTANIIVKNFSVWTIVLWTKIMTPTKPQILKLVSYFLMLDCFFLIFLLHLTCEKYKLWRRYTEVAHLSALLHQSSRSYMLALEMMTNCTNARPRLPAFLFWKLYWYLKVLTKIYLNSWS